MPKSSHVPKELKGFSEIFNKLSQKYEQSRVWSDYLAFEVYKLYSDQVLAQKEAGNVLLQYEEDEHHLFDKLSQEAWQVFTQYIGVTNWYDLFGTFHERLNTKTSLGQFFTPESICNLMRNILEGPMDKPGTIKGKKILDPTCGSGRNLLAYYARQPENYFFGSDIDLDCCKMSIINFAWHGITGEIVHKDALSSDCFWHGWDIVSKDEDLIVPFQVLPIEKEGSFIWQQEQYLIQQSQKRAQEQIEQTRKDKAKQLALDMEIPMTNHTLSSKTGHKRDGTGPAIGNGEQLTLF